MREHVATHEPFQPDLMDMAEYQARTGQGWTTVREAARLNKLLVPVLRSGRRYFVSRRAFEAVLERQHDESNASSAA